MIKSWTLRALLVLVVLVWVGTNPSSANAAAVQDQCQTLVSLSDQQKEELGIAQAEWKTSDGIITTPHCRIVIVAGAGEFSSTGLLTDSNQNLPSAGFLRVPQCYNGTRALFFRPGASFDLTQALGPAATFLRECTVVMNMWYPTFATLSGFRELFFAAPNNYRDPQKALSLMMHLGRDILNQFFGAPLYNYYHGGSQGGLDGEVISEFSDLAWIHGWVFQAGGDGPSRFLFSIIWSCQQDPTSPPISKLTDVTSAHSCTAQNLANLIGRLDPEYREEILKLLATEGEEAALRHALAYDVAERKQSVQNDVAFTTPKGDLQAKTIILHGLIDDTVSIDDTLRYLARIVAVGRQDVVRAYFSEVVPHALPPIVNITFVRKMFEWVEQDIEPGTVLTVQNGTDLGFGNDPCGYFDFVHGSTGCNEILGL